MVECLLVLILEEAELLTAATPGIDCLVPLLVHAHRVAAGLDLILPAKVSYNYYKAFV